MHKFYTDSMLGKLARFLRFLGYDTLYRSEETIDEMLEESFRSTRILISQSQKVISLSEKKKIQSIYLDSIDISSQLQKIRDTLDFSIIFPPETMRCSVCNGNLTSKEKQELLDRIPEGTAKHYDEFWECDSCAKIFWLGSHWEDIKRVIDDLK